MTWECHDKAADGGLCCYWHSAKSGWKPERHCNQSCCCEKCPALGQCMFPCAVRFIECPTCNGVGVVLREKDGELVALPPFPEPEGI